MKVWIQRKPVGLILIAFYLCVISLLGFAPVASGVTEGQSYVASCKKDGEVNESCYFRYRYSPEHCVQRKCSKLLIFFSGGEMKCDDSFGNQNAAYSRVLKAYNDKGYLAVCAGIFLNAESSASIPIYKESVRVDTLVKNIAESRFVQDHWTGEHLLLGGISHGATAPVAAMAVTTKEGEKHWKGTRTTGACFLDGVYSPFEADAFLRSATPPITNPSACVDLRNRTICNRYFGEDDCDPLKGTDAGMDEITSLPASNFQISNWKLVECGSGLRVSPCVGDMVPAAPIESLCTSLKSSGKSCTFAGLPNESHSACMSGGGISACREWFDDLVAVRNLPPASPSSLTASVSGQTVQLSWRDRSNDEEAFEVERKLEGAVAFRPLHTTSRNAVSYTDSNVPSGRHSYRVRATKAGLYSSFSNTVTATVVAPPNAPSHLKVRLLWQGFELQWKDNSSNEQGFEIERSYNSSSNFVFVGRGRANDPQYLNLGAFRRGTYYFRVRAYNSGGYSNHSNVIAVER